MEAWGRQTWPEPTDAWEVGSASPPRSVTELNATVCIVQLWLKWGPSEWDIQGQGEGSQARPLPCVVQTGKGSEGRLAGAEIFLPQGGLLQYKPRALVGGEGARTAWACGKGTAWTRPELARASCDSPARSQWPPGCTWLLQMSFPSRSKGPPHLQILAPVSGRS